MGEMPSAWQCDYCRELMVPIERKTDRWHTKWCSKCGAKLWDVFVGESEVGFTADGVAVVRDRSWRTDPHDNDYGTDAD